MSPNSAEETHHDKPFEIDLDNLSSYDQKELQAFIKKYEQYTHSLRGQFNDLLNECLLAREKLTLLDEERKRLMVENDQYKNQIEVFKKLVDEKALQAGAGPDFDREAIENSGLEFEKKELNISKQLKENAEKLIEELKKIILMSNGEEVKKAPEFVKKEMEDVDRQGQEESPREEARTTSGSDSECKPEAEPVNEAEAEQTEQQEEKEEVENPEEMKNNEVPQSHQSESPTGEEDKMSSVLEKVELELRKVLEEHWNTIDAMLKKEKEMSLRLNMEILKGRKMEEYEKEIKELKGTAKDAEKLLQDTIVELQDKVKEVEKNEKIVE